MSGTRVAIIGGGASGTLQALHLVRAGVANVTLIERERRPGRGVAYSTGRAEHLLNVPARRMSAYPDDPDHFTRWFEARGGDAEQFAPRMLYGDYLEELLAQNGSAVTIVRGEAVNIRPGAVRLADGRQVEADTVVLAPGNFRPATPRGIDPEALGPLWVADPWASEIDDGLDETDTVLLLGTGLTAVDAILTLEAKGFRGHILALSRRGLAPRGHGQREPADGAIGPLPSACVPLLRQVRARSAAVGWRSAVHELRNVTNEIWNGASLAEKRRFLRHLRPWWDVHRHKIAPAVAARVEAMEREGRLTFAAGKLVSVKAAAREAEIYFRPRGSEASEIIRAARIMNCTGPETNIARSGEPLLQSLLDAGRIRPDPSGIGLHVDEECRTLDSGGAASESLFAIGPITRGAFWESVAVPDIRVQAQRVARRLAEAAA
jgi:uncharacterized NAD(P)/FAD-binding protein YdhS